MASESTPPARDARSASTLYEWPCSGSEMPRYSRRKCAASKRASTRTVNLPGMRLRKDVGDQRLRGAELAQLVLGGLAAKQLDRPPVVPARIGRVFPGEMDQRE